MGSVVLHRGLFHLNATCITVALHDCNGRRANSQHGSTQNSHFSRLRACDCLVFKMVIEKTPFHAGTGAGIFPPLSPAKKLLLSILHCDNGISGKRDIRGILNLLHTEMDKQLRHIAIMMMILAACGGRNYQKNQAKRLHHEVASLCLYYDLANVVIFCQATRHDVVCTP